MIQLHRICGTTFNCTSVRPYYQLSGKFCTQPLCPLGEARTPWPPRPKYFCEGDNFMRQQLFIAYKSGYATNVLNQSEWHGSIRDIPVFLELELVNVFWYTGSGLLTKPEVAQDFMYHHLQNALGMLNNDDPTMLWTLIVIWNVFQLWKCIAHINP